MPSLAQQRRHHQLLQSIHKWCDLALQKTPYHAPSAARASLPCCCHLPEMLLHGAHKAANVMPSLLQQRRLQLLTASLPTSCNLPELLPHDAHKASKVTLQPRWLQLLAASLPCCCDLLELLPHGAKPPTSRCSSATSSCSRITALLLQSAELLPHGALKAANVMPALQQRRIQHSCACITALLLQSA